MNPDFNKVNGLLPVIIQDADTLEILMLGYMNEEAYEKTLMEKKVTFFSRSKNRLWTKGETSGHFLWAQNIYIDCDADSLLIKASAEGPTCHTGSTSCFNTTNAKGFLYRLEQTIRQRISKPQADSYTSNLYRSGINKIAQKVGEEAVELIIEAKDNHPDLFVNEAADLLYHFLILLATKQVALEDVEAVLKARSREKPDA